MKWHLARIHGQNVRPCTHVNVDVQMQTNAYLENSQQKKEARKITESQLARPPSIPSPPPGFPPTHEEVSGSASTKQTSRFKQPPSISISAGTSTAVRCNLFAPLNGQTILESEWNSDKFKEAKKAVGNF